MCATALSLFMLSCKSSDHNTPAASATVDAGVQRIDIRATENGFEPSEIHFRQGTRAIMAFERVVNRECVNAVRMPWRQEPYPLPLNEKVEIEIPDTSKPGTFTYACWMNMVSGRVFIDPS
jgi:plastocyanin domain-containing protein